MIIISAFGATLFLGGFSGRSRWLALARDQGRGAAVPLHLAAGHAAAALRPPDEVRLEGAAAAGRPLTWSSRGRRRSSGSRTRDGSHADRGLAWASPSPSARCRSGPRRSATRSARRPCSRASAAATASGATRTASRSASGARCAWRRARPTASASWPRRTRRSTASPWASGTRGIYEINMARCIFCGYCEPACPFDAITLENEYGMPSAPAPS